MAVLAATLVAGTLAPLLTGALPAVATHSGKVALPQGAPSIPSAVARLGSVPGTQMVPFDVSLAGQDPAGLSQFVAAVSTPGSPTYRHYLTAPEFAARFGPTAAEVSAVTAQLRSEGLTVGTAAPGSLLLPVRGRASVVSAALATPLESVRLPDHTVSLVNLATPQIPASLAGAVTGIVGLDGLAREHAMFLHGHASGTAGPPQSRALVSHAGSPQACGSAASAAGSTNYTSTQLASIYGLDQLFAQGRTGIGQTIGVVEFEQFSPSDIMSFEACYGLTNPVNTVTVDGPVGGLPSGQGEAALDIELATVNAPSASVLVYEAPNDVNNVAAIDLLNRIANDDLAKVITTSWGICEAMIGSEANTESSIFSRMAAQGQTIVAASGDSGSEDCFSAQFNPTATGLAVDDPGAQPDVLSAGGTTMSPGTAPAQTTWNNCQGVIAALCADSNSSAGAGGGGFSMLWAKPTWQPGPSGGSSTDPCFPAGLTCRSVPDVSASSDPAHGVVALFGGAWRVFGGTSVVAPLEAGLFADTNQGCTNALGLVGPALYAANNSANFTDVTTGNNDFLDNNSGKFPATASYDVATGLGAPRDQNLAIALQGGADGCPSVASLSSQSGPVTGGPAITISGGGLGDATSVSFGSAGNGQIVTQSKFSLTVIPPSPSGPICVNVTVTNPQGISVNLAADAYAFGGSSNCAGYRFVASDGGIFDFGSSAFEGSTGNLTLNSPIVGMALTPSSNGYWLVAADGGIFTFGDANFFGSMGATHLNKPIVGMAAAPDGRGYWLVASDGGIFNFGSAHFFGSMGATHLNKPIVGMAPGPGGAGYFMVASDGGIFTFGSANFHGSTGALRLNQPIVGMAVTYGGGGYWLVASDGGIFTFGDAAFHGSTGAIRLNQPIVGMSTSADGGGYWLVAADGGIFSFGDAVFYGSTGNIHLNNPIVGMAAG
jgi:hypothetical protein